MNNENHNISLLEKLKSNSPDRFLNGRFKRNVQLAIVHWPEKHTFNIPGTYGKTISIKHCYHHFYIVDMKHPFVDSIKWLPTQRDDGFFDYDSIQESNIHRKIWHFGNLFTIEEKDWPSVYRMLNGGSGHAVLYLNDDNHVIREAVEFKLIAGRKKILFLTLHAFAAFIRHSPNKYRSCLTINRKVVIRNDKRLNEMIKGWKKVKTKERINDWHENIKSLYYNKTQ